MEQEEQVTPKESPLVSRNQFEAVDGNTPLPPGHVRFQTGERLAWKGLWFQVVGHSGDKIVLQVVGVTAKNKPKATKRHASRANVKAMRRRKQRSKGKQ